MAIDITSLGQGGAERQTLVLANGLRRRGHEVLLMVHKEVDAYEGEILSTGLPAIECRRNGRFDVRLFFDLAGLMRMFRPEICITVGYNASLWGRLALLTVGCRSVQAEHATRLRTPLKVRMTHHLLGWVSQAVVACARAQVPSLVRAGVRKDRIVVIPNGVDTAQFCPSPDEGVGIRRSLGIPSDAFVVGLVAGHRKEKRHDRFISVIEKLADTGLHVWGVMIGGGPELTTTARRAELSPVSQRLRITGPLDEMRAAYAALDVAVLVSDDVETYPMCFLEAQACGVPVVGMDVGGVRETFEDGVTGVLVRDGDVVGMADALRRIALDSSLRARLSRDARVHARRSLSVERMVAEYETLLTGLVGRTRCSPADAAD